MSLKIKWFICIAGISILLCVIYTKIVKSISDTEDVGIAVECNDTFWTSDLASNGAGFYAIHLKGSASVQAFPYRFIIAEEYRYVSDLIKGSTTEPVSRTSVEYYRHNVYDLQTGKKIKVIDTNTLIENIYPEYQPVFGFDSEPVLFNDKLCLRVCIEKSPGSESDIDKNTMKIAYIDIENDKVYLQDYSMKDHEIWRSEIWIPKINMYDIFNSGKPNNLLSVNGFSNSFVSHANVEETCYIQIPINMLPEENEQLYRMFPQLKNKVQELLKLDDMDINDPPAIQIYLTNNPTVEDILGLIMEDGEKVKFDGWKLEWQDSIDGKEHKLNGFKEFYQYWKNVDLTMAEREFVPLISLEE